MIKKDLQKILEEPKFKQRLLFEQYIRSMPEDTPEAPKLPKKRTNSQNAALHVHFQQIADLCQNEGIEADAIFKETHHILMTPELVKSLWKALQLALFGKKSTTELSKTGEIEKLDEHFVRFFGEKFGIEIPPFPSENKNVKLESIKDKKDYPEHTAPTI